MKVSSSMREDDNVGAKRVRQDQLKPTRVQVLVRMRPALEQEIGTPEADLHMCTESNTINMTHIGREYTFGVDKIFGPQSTQGEVYQGGGLEEVVGSVMEGRNACIFAYGNTGTGKTFTMQGGEGSNKDGVVAIAVRQVLDKAKAMSRGGKACVTVVMSLMEIYNDKLRDLLLTAPPAPGAKELAIREDHEGTICVPGLTEKVIESYGDFESIYSHASASRKTSSTHLNSQSSRSHAVLMIKVTKKPAEEAGKKPSTTTATKRSVLGMFNKKGPSSNVVVGKLNLIDLAGSERNSKTGNRGERLQESGNINLSLFVLGKVIDGLNAGDSRIPYRDSKLTRLLQDSLHPGSASRAIMICCIAPSAAMAGETCQSLGYASKARSITNVPKALHPGDEMPAPPTPSLKRPTTITTTASRTTTTTTGGLDPSAKNKLDQWRMAKQQSSSSTTTTSTVPPPPPSSSGPSTAAAPALKRKWEGSTTATTTATSSAAAPSDKENDNDSQQRKAAAAGQSTAPTKVPVNPPSTTTTTTTKPAPTATSGNESMVAAKDMIVQARDLEKEGKLDEALRLYEAAELLLPGHQKLNQRLSHLREKIREQRESRLGLMDNNGSSSSVAVRGGGSSSSSGGVSSSSMVMMMAVESPITDNAELLHSAIKERGGAGRVFTAAARNGDHDEEEGDGDMMQIDFGGEMMEEDVGGNNDYDDDDDLPPPMRSSSMTPPDAKVNAADKEECLKSLHKEIKNVLEAEIVEILNQGTDKQLLKLNGIGKKRAELIMQIREEEPFRAINDLGKIGLTTVMIAKILKANAMQRLEVCA